MSKNKSAWKKLWNLVVEYLPRWLVRWWLPERPSEGPRSPLERSVTQDDLRPGDIFLCRGKGDLSDIIAHIDGGAYTHAAMVDSRGYVIEATRGGVVAHELDQEWKNHCHFIDLYRFRTGRRGASPPGWVEPASLRAALIAADGLKYAYHELLVGAIVLVASRKPSSKHMRAAIRLIGGQFIKWLDDEITQRDGKRPMACTEVVCTSFWEADETPSRSYGIEISLSGHLYQMPTPPAIAAPFSMPSVEELDAMSDEVLEEQYDRLRWNLQERLGGPPPFAAEKDSREWVKAGEADMPLSFIRPSDLERSRSLAPLGNLWQAQADPPREP